MFQGVEGVPAITDGSGSGDIHFSQLHTKQREDSSCFERAILKTIWSLLIVWRGGCELPYFTQPNLRKGPAEVLSSLTLDWWCLCSLQGCREGAVTSNWPSWPSRWITLPNSALPQTRQGAGMTKRGNDSLRMSGAVERRLSPWAKEISLPRSSIVQ